MSTPTERGTSRSGMARAGRTRGRLRRLRASPREVRLTVKTPRGVTMSNIPPMDDTPAPAGGTPSGIPSMEDATPPQGAGERLLKANAKNLLSVADLVGSIPAALVGTMADAGFRVRGIVKGESRREIGEEGNIAYQVAMEQYGNPFSKLLKFAGVGKDDAAGTPSGVDGLMAKASNYISKGGEWVEKHTGGAVQKEDVSSLV